MFYLNLKYKSMLKYAQGTLHSSDFWMNGKGFLAFHAAKLLTIQKSTSHTDKIEEIGKVLAI